MKWRVEIEYEDGSFTEPRRIAFQAVYDGEPYHGYDTKKEALEAFCLGQVAMSKFLEESKAQQEQAEQKKEEEKGKKCDKDITFCHDCLRAKTCKQKVEKEKAFEESGVSFSKFGDTAFVLENKFEEALFKRFEERLNPRLEALEKKVDGLEKGLAQLTDTFYICANNETHNYEDLRKKVAELEEWRIRHLMIFHDKPLTEEQQKKADKLFLEQMNK